MSIEKSNSQDLRERKKDHGYFFDTVKLVSGNSIAQAIKSILSIVISRLYLPEFFGITQNFSSIVNIVSYISSLRYEQTIILPKEEKKAINQLHISLIFTSITSFLMFVAISLWGGQIAQLLNSPALKDYLWLVPLNVLAFGIFNIFSQWSTRKRKFSRLASARIINETVVEGTTVGLGFLSLASSGTMIFSRILGQVVSMLFLGVKTIREIGKDIYTTFNFKQILAGISQYRNFPLLNLWSSLLNNLALYLPAIILSAYFSPTIAGYFSLGQNVLRLPIALISASISQVFLQRATQSFHDGTLKSTVEQTFKQLVNFGMFPMLALMIIGEDLFVLFFGSNWATAGVFSQILSLWTLAIFISTPLLNLIIILEKNEMGLLLNFAKVIAGAGSLIYGGLINNITVGLVLFSIFGVITYGGFIIWALRISGIPVMKTLAYFWKNCLITLPFLVLIFIFKTYNPIPDITITGTDIYLPRLGLIVFTLLIGIIYFINLVVRDKTIIEPVRFILGKHFPNKKDKHS
jgi:O-antigen/teichoic acid export membrane protein